MSEPTSPSSPSTADQTSTGHARIGSASSTIIPFIILAGVTLIVLFLFLLLVWPYLLSLVTATIGVLMFQPAMDWLTKRLGGRAYLAAGLITTLLIVLVVVPLGLAVWIGVGELRNGIAAVQDYVANNGDQINGWLKRIDERFAVSRDEIKQRAEDIGRSLLSMVLRWGGGLVGGTIETIIQTMVILAAFFFFLVDGRKLVAGWEQLTPLDVAHDRYIREEFARVCRGAIWGTIVAAVMQGVLLALGLAVVNWLADAGMESWIFLVGGITSVVAVIPFIGAAGVWAPLAGILWYQGHTSSAIVLAFYGLIIVSSVDNLIKIVLIKDSADLHPLLVLVCVFGGLQLMGFLGVFLGPAIGAIVFALMRVLRQELSRITKKEEAKPLPSV